MFDVNATKYELWEVKFLGLMRLQKLYNVLLAKGELDDEDMEKNNDALRAKTAAATLKSAAESVSDSLLIAMVLKGLRAV